MTGEQKQAFANEAEKALDHPLVSDVIDEFLDNIGRSGDKLARYGATKIAMYTATVARALALGVDPDELRLSAGEANAEILRKAQIIADAGKPVIVVMADGQ